MPSTQYESPKCLSSQESLKFSAALGQNSIHLQPPRSILQRARRSANHSRKVRWGLTTIIDIPSRHTLRAIPTSGLWEGLTSNEKIEDVPSASRNPSTLTKKQIKKAAIKHRIRARRKHTVKPNTQAEFPMSRPGTLFQRDIALRVGTLDKSLHPMLKSSAGEHVYAWFDPGDSLAFSCPKWGSKCQESIVRRSEMTNQGFECTHDWIHFDQSYDTRHPKQRRLRIKMEMENIAPITENQ